MHALPCTHTIERGALAGIPFNPEPVPGPLDDAETLNSLLHDGLLAERERKMLEKQRACNQAQHSRRGRASARCDLGVQPCKANQKRGKKGAAKKARMSRARQAISSAPQRQVRRCNYNTNHGQRQPGTAARSIHVAHGSVAHPSCCIVSAMLLM